mmetsp:Transcript_76969/g.249364  ORF Transcript_76969/g.249364 Transcript_76969/m.249364 type:complete len:248 (-) Transcript_76969:9-752(-)
MSMAAALRWVGTSAWPRCCPCAGSSSAPSSRSWGAWSRAALRSRDARHCSSTMRCGCWLPKTSTASSPARSSRRPRRRCCGRRPRACWGPLASSVCCRRPLRSCRCACTAPWPGRSLTSGRRSPRPAPSDLRATGAWLGGCRRVLLLPAQGQEWRMLRCLMSATSRLLLAPSVSAWVSVPRFCRCRGPVVWEAQAAAAAAAGGCWAARTAAALARRTVTSPTTRALASCVRMRPRCAEPRSLPPIGH